VIDLQAIATREEITRSPAPAAAEVAAARGGGCAT
jgi:hypothetical protein